MEEDQLLLDSARLQLTSLRDADYALHEIPGKQRHFISSFYDCFGNFASAYNCVSSYVYFYFLLGFLHDEIKQCH